MEDIKIRRYPIKFVDFTFINKYKDENVIIDIEFDSVPARYETVNLYADYNISFNEFLSITDINLLDAYSSGSNKLVFNCEYFERDKEDFDEMGDFIETIQKEISFKDLMKDSRYIGNELLSRTRDEKYRYPTFKNPERFYTGVESVNKYGEKTSEFESKTEVGFEFDDEKTELKMNSIYFEIDCRNSINTKDWNVLEVYCSFY